MIGQIPQLISSAPWRRGESRKDIDEVANTIIKVGWILHNCSAISDIESTADSVQPR